MFSLVRANGDEICARLGIIIFLQPDGTPVVEIGGFIVGSVHGNFLFHVGRMAIRRSTGVFIFGFIKNHSLTFPCLFVLRIVPYRSFII